MGRFHAELPIVDIPGESMAALQSVKSWHALASALGTTRRTLQSWRERFPDECPRPIAGAHDVETWRQFALDHDLRPSHDWEPAMPSAPRTAPIADTREQTIMRRTFCDFTLTASALSHGAEKYFPGNVEEARAELNKINAAADRLYDLAGLMEPGD